MKFLLEIITPQRKAFSEEIDAVVVPTTDGIIEVMARHEPLFTSLAEGELKILSNGKEFFLAIGGGFMEVRPNAHVTVLVSRAVHASEINEAEIHKAMESAKALIARKATGDELAHALTVLHRSSLELKIKRRKSHPFGGMSIS